MLVRYAYGDGKMTRRVFERESERHYHWRDPAGGPELRLAKGRWYETEAEALRAYVARCDRELDLLRGSFQKWEQRAKEAFVLLCKELAGTKE